MEYVSHLVNKEKTNVGARSFNLEEPGCQLCVLLGLSGAEGHRFQEKGTWNVFLTQQSICGEE